jgi:septum formation protein
MAFDKKFKLILGSLSPRRKELLSWLDIPFEILGAEIEESSDELRPDLVCEDISYQKAQAIWQGPVQERLEQGQSPFVVTSDTLVALGQEIFGKPRDKNEAREMLLKLSGKEHTVISAVTLMAEMLGEKKELTFSCQTKVTFDVISEDILIPYLESRDSLDKAGAYGIQGKGLTFISHLEGSYSNVVGFPLSHFISEFKNFLELPVGKESSWRSYFE